MNYIINHTLFNPDMDYIEHDRHIAGDTYSIEMHSREVTKMFSIIN